MKREFNLLSESWIKVMDYTGKVATVSLSDVLLNAHNYLDLAGALPTLNVALLRQMLALLFAALANVDEHGNPDIIRSKQQAYDRWKVLWIAGRFPEELLKNYFDKWYDRFWLIDDERPFGQVQEARIGTEYTAAKLNGELSESSNKTKLFSLFSGTSKNEMSYAEAANWLIYVNAYDDTSAKPKGKNLPSVGAGWLGKLGLIEAVGKNLFETLMLNLTLLQNGDELWGNGCPAWELSLPRTAERTKIAIPQNLAALYTVQSRRLLLKQSEEGRISGFNLLGGDFFDKENCFAEQMTVWRYTEGKKGEPDVYTPKRHNSSRQLWRDFDAIVSANPDGTKNKAPGVVEWVSNLQQRRIIDRTLIVKFRISSVQYGDKDFFVTDVFGDSLAFHSELLSERGRYACVIALEMIKMSESMAYECGRLASNLYIAGGGDSGEKILLAEESEKGRQKLYYALDEPFRVWLEQLDPSDRDLVDSHKEEWRKLLQKTALDLGHNLVSASGESAFVGRYISEVKGETAKKRHYSASEAFNWFSYNVNKIKEGR